MNVGLSPDACSKNSFCNGQRNLKKAIAAGCECDDVHGEDLRCSLSCEGEPETTVISAARKGLARMVISVVFCTEITQQLEIYALISKSIATKNNLVKAIDVQRGWRDKVNTLKFKL